MNQYLEAFINGYKGYASYLWKEICNPSLTNYFYWLIGISVFFLLLEWLTPWRKKQARFRKDFWLDCFYMFFNFFLFSLIIYVAISDVVVVFLNNIIKGIFNFDLQANNPLNSWPMWSVLLIGFLVRDFVQWWTHRLLHRVKFLWEFHKVHHSVEQMGFAAHLRFHWMETVVYRTIEYLPLALLGLGLYDFFIIHLFTLSVGHYNHSNLTVPGRLTAFILGIGVGVIMATSSFDVSIFDTQILSEQLLIIGVSALIFMFFIGPIMKLVFNSPEMHIWHHAYELPDSKQHGVNFGLTLAIWDFIFNTAYIPHNGKNIRLGFPEVESFPDNFLGQVSHGFKKK